MTASPNDPHILLEFPIKEQDRQVIWLPHWSMPLSVYAPGGKRVLYAMIPNRFVVASKEKGYFDLDNEELEHHGDFVPYTITELSASLRRTVTHDYGRFLNTFNILQKLPQIARDAITGEETVSTQTVQAIFHAFVKEGP
jgi:hypothetical protein